MCASVLVPPGPGLDLRGAEQLFQEGRWWVDMGDAHYGSRGRDDKAKGGGWKREEAGEGFARGPPRDTSGATHKDGDTDPQSPANMAVPRERRACGAEVTKPEVRPRLRGLGARGRGWRTVSGAMPRAAGLGRAAALGPLLAAHVVAAIEPISVGIALGAASALTGYLSYTDLYCRFAECCREEQRLNASGRAGPPARGAALTLSWGGREDGRGLGPDSRPASRAC